MTVPGPSPQLPVWQDLWRTESQLISFTGRLLAYVQDFSDNHQNIWKVFINGRHQGSGDSRERAQACAERCLEVRAQ